MVSFPPCKINLGLHVVRKRNDGFHDIETCFYPLPFTDILEIIPGDSFAFTTSGMDIPGDQNDNLCVRAYRMLRDEGYLHSNALIHLHKIIPSGAGLGGGSSDAAHTLRLLNTTFDLNLSIPQLENFAARLGSDCAFFVHNTPMMGSGRGEVLTPVDVPLNGKFLVLLNPGIHVSTAVAFAGVSPNASRVSIASLVQEPVTAWRTLLVNDFEQTVFAGYPAIREIKEKLYAAGAIYAAMTGTGSSVYGIFSEEFEMSDLAEKHILLWKGVLP